MIENDLFELLSLTIPEPHKHEPTFLDITGQTFKENTISRVYAYFLNSENNREIATLFLDALIELIQEKANKKIQFQDFTCRTEQTTKKGNRIDLIINSETEKKCFIIENKIFHYLNNDLDDYWTINDFQDCNKAGIVLTLKRQTIAQELKSKFINVTHKEWIDRIRSKGLPIGINAKEFVYLSDFIKHIENITESMKMNEQAKFFFNYPDKVLKAINTHNEAYTFINAQLNLVAEKMDWKLYGSSKDWRHIWDEKNKAQIYYAIEIYKLFDKEPQINIIIEMYKEAIQKQDMYKQILIDNSFYLKMSDEGRRGNGWLHFTNRWYKLTVSDIENLSNYILNKLQEDFNPVMNILLEQEGIPQLKNLIPTLHSTNR